MPLHLREIERLLEWKLQIFNIYYSYIYCLSGKLSNFYPFGIWREETSSGRDVSVCVTMRNWCFQSHGFSQNVQKIIGSVDWLYWNSIPLTCIYNFVFQAQWCWLYVDKCMIGAVLKQQERKMGPTTTTQFDCLLIHWAQNKNKKKPLGIATKGNKLIQKHYLKHSRINKKSISNLVTGKINCLTFHSLGLWKTIKDAKFLKFILHCTYTVFQPNHWGFSPIFPHYGTPDDSGTLARHLRS